MLARLPLFVGLGEAERARIASATSRRELKRGEFLFRQGEQPTGFYLVVHGRIELRARSPQGRERVTDIVGAGRSFGEAIMFLEQPCIVSARALGDALALHVAKDALLVADAAVVCVGPDPAAAVLASPYLHAVEAAGTPAIIFINRIDEAGGQVRDVVAALQDYVQHPIVLRQVPIREGDRVVGAVDLVSERAWAYREGQRSELIEIPAGMLEREPWRRTTSRSSSREG